MLSQAREDARDLTAAASPTAEIATERLPHNGGEIWRLSGPWINTTAVAASKRLDKVAYVRFASVYRSFEDVDEFSRLIKEI